MKRVLLIVFAATILFACNTERKKQSTNAADQVPVEQESPELIEGTIDDDDIPESMWTRNFYNGTLSGGGKTYNITMAISFPGTGAFPCSIVGSYQYKGHDDSISLEGDWIELTDLYEQYPQYFAGIAPMDATGIAVQGARLLDPEKSNQDVLVPMFYIGGCASPLPELPKHGEASCERFRYLARVNQWKQGSEINFEDKENWADPEICLVGEKVEHLSDEVFPQSDYVLHSFESADGNVYTQIMAVTNHQHELRRFTNECCWNFLKHFRRKADGRNRSRKRCLRKLPKKGHNRLPGHQDAG